jgi:hypothetical protein
MKDIINFELAGKLGYKGQESPFSKNLEDFKEIADNLNKFEIGGLLKIVSSLEFETIYLIYSNGNIELDSKSNANNFQDTRTAYYYLTNDKLIFICAVQEIKTSRRKTREVVSTLPANLTKEEHFYKERNPNNDDNKLNADNRYFKPSKDVMNNEIYVDGVREKNGIYKYEIHKYELEKKDSPITLVRIPDNLSLNVGQGITISHVFRNTNRRYIHPSLLAAYIGALFELKESALVSTGSCFLDGTCFPSILHNNGESMDISFDIKTKKLSNLSGIEFQKIKAFKKFHFQEVVISELCEAQISKAGFSKSEINYDLVGHKDHFHFGKFNFEKIKVRKIDRFSK